MRQLLKTLLCVSLATWFHGAVSALAEVKLPPVISSHMLLQRDTTVPILGTATPDEKGSVKFRGQEKSATAEAAAWCLNWRVFWANRVWSLTR